MSKSSRLKHEKPAFEPANDAPIADEDLCTECGFFAKLENRDICGYCEEMEQNSKVPM